MNVLHVLATRQLVNRCVRTLLLLSVATGKIDLGTYNKCKELGSRSQQASWYVQIR